MCPAREKISFGLQNTANWLRAIADEIALCGLRCIWFALGPTRKERVRKALTEMGFPNAEVSGPEDEPRVLVANDGWPGSVPPWACSRAFEEAG